MDKIVSKANQGKPDPITNRRMSDACWNNKHRGQKEFTPVCGGWVEDCAKCSREIDKETHAKPCSCPCHGVKCNCACHDDREYKPKIRRDHNASMNIMDTGCGTIEIKR